MFKDRRAPQAQQDQSASVAAPDQSHRIVLCLFLFPALVCSELLFPPSAPAKVAVKRASRQWQRQQWGKQMYYRPAKN